MSLFSNEAEASDSISSDIRNESIPELKPDEAAGPANPSSAGSSKLIENWLIIYQVSQQVLDKNLAKSLKNFPQIYRS